MITDESYGGATRGREADEFSEFEGAGHAGLVNHDEAAGVDAICPCRQRGSVGESGCQRRDRAARGVHGRLQPINSNVGGSSRDHGAATVLPRPGEDPHGRGFPCASWRQSELHPATRGRELAYQAGLLRIQLDAVGD